MTSNDSLPNRIQTDLRVLRELAGEKLGVVVTPAMAADMVLVSRRAWQRWENSYKSVPVGVIKRFCACAGIDFNEWMKRENSHD